MYVVLTPRGSKFFQNADNTATRILSNAQKALKDALVMTHLNWFDFGNYSLQLAFHPKEMVSILVKK
jgi:hypothetical protein